MGVVVVVVVRVECIAFRDDFLVVGRRRSGQRGAVGGRNGALVEDDRGRVY